MCTQETKQKKKSQQRNSQEMKQLGRERNTRKLKA